MPLPREGIAVVAVLASMSLGCSAPPPTVPPPQPPVVARPKAPTGPADPVVQVASRGDHACALTKAGHVMCWGKNTYGQLGNGTRDDSARAVRVPLVDAAELSLGVDFSCARRRGGTVVCWGNDQDGQLGTGRGGKPGQWSTKPIRVAQLEGAVQISAGEYHACARMKDGTLRCWGNAADGQLGSAEERVFATPRTIPGVSGVVSVASGASHVCVLDASGGVRCWGRNTEGELGDGQLGSRIKPVVVRGLSDVVELSAGARHSCARRRDGKVACWGDNASGQLGAAAGRDAKRYEPVIVAGLSDVVELALGGNHSCARHRTGSVACWGGNEHGQLGHVASPKQRNVPTLVHGLPDAIDLSLGERHSCAARGRGDASCWGRNEHGALGPHPLR
jgi:alpha-tubulin suppressor-like RCC1 family protein